MFFCYVNTRPEFGLYIFGYVVVRRDVVPHLVDWDFVVEGISPWFL